MKKLVSIILNIITAIFFIIGFFVLLPLICRSNTPRFDETMKKLNKEDYGNKHITVE